MRLWCRQAALATREAWQLKRQFLAQIAELADKPGASETAFLPRDGAGVPSTHDSADSLFGSKLEAAFSHAVDVAGSDARLSASATQLQQQRHLEQLGAFGTSTPPLPAFAASSASHNGRNTPADSGALGVAGPGSGVSGGSAVKRTPTPHDVAVVDSGRHASGTGSDSHEGVPVGRVSVVNGAVSSTSGGDGDGDGDDRHAAAPAPLAVTGASLPSVSWHERTGSRGGDTSPSHALVASPARSTSTAAPIHSRRASSVHSVESVSSFMGSSNFHLQPPLSPTHTLWKLDDGTIGRAPTTASAPVAAAVVAVTSSSGAGAAADGPATAQAANMDASVPWWERKSVDAEDGPSARASVDGDDDGVSESDSSGEYRPSWGVLRQGGSQYALSLE